MNKRSSFVRSAALAGAIALGATVAPVLPVAVAQESTADASTITQSTGKLTIHKKANPTDLGTPTGEVDNSVTGTNLEGVGFTIYKINDIDMSTNAGLVAAAGKTAANYVKDGAADTTKVTAIDGGERKTDSNGEIVLNDLPIGAYLVVETSPKEGYLPAAPFVAFVPMTKGNADAQGTTWNYDVHAYPKNYEKKPPVKTVKDEAQNVGGTIEYNIDTTVRNIATGKRLKYYFIEDTLDAKNLDVKNAQIAVTIDGNEATKDTDYTLTKDDTTGHFKVSLTVAGLKKLKSGFKVNVNVKAEKLTDDAVVPNDAREYEPSNPSTDMDVEDETTPPETPESDYYETPPVFTYFGEIDFTKVNSGREGLAGAEFQVFRISNNGQCEDKAPSTGALTAWNGAADATPNPVDTFVSGEDGKVRIAGLHVNDFANNADVAEGDQDAYCIYETKAPAGKELLSKGYKFQLLKSDETTTVTKTIYKYTDENGDGVYEQTTEERPYTVPVYKPVSWTVGDNEGEVVNLDDTTPNLPMTGGMGIGILAAIGAAIVALGAWFARRSSAQN